MINRIKKNKKKYKISSNNYITKKINIKYTNNIRLHQRFHGVLRLP